jgi:hypothetical protein
MNIGAASGCAMGCGQTSIGTTIPFDVVDTPGTYVCTWSGHLLRVPRRAVTLGCTPALNIVGREPLTVTKISDDPEIPLSEAKRIAARYRVPVNF